MRPLVFVTVSPDDRCPLCGGVLLLTRGPSGYFVGCSGFHTARRCKFSASPIGKVHWEERDRLASELQESKKLVDELRAVATARDNDLKTLGEENSALYSRIAHLERQLEERSRPVQPLVHDKEFKVKVLAGWFDRHGSIKQDEYCELVTKETGVYLSPRTLRTWLKQVTFKTFDLDVIR